MSNAQHESLSNEHGTTPYVLEIAREVMGGIDLDPASSATFNKAVQAKQFFHRRKTGITRDWNGSVYLNPPGGVCDAKGRRVMKVKGFGYLYEDSIVFERDGETIIGGKKMQGVPFSSACLWWFKLINEWATGNIDQAFFMGFSLELIQRTQQYARRTDLPWTARALPTDFPRAYPEKRLPFTQERDGELKPGTSPTHANIIVYLPPRTYGEQRTAFKRLLKPHGVVKWEKPPERGRAWRDAS